MSATPNTETPDIEALKAKLANSRGLKGTQLTGVEVVALYGAGERVFSCANLRDANLRGANLEDANLEDAKHAVAVIGVGEISRYAWAWNTGKSAGIQLGCQTFDTFEAAIEAVKAKYDTDEYRRYLPAYLAGLEYMRLQLEVNLKELE